MNISDATPLARLFAWLHQPELADTDRRDWRTMDATGLLIAMCEDHGYHECAQVVRARAAGEQRRLAWVGDGRVEVIE